MKERNSEWKAVLAFFATAILASVVSAGTQLLSDGAFDAWPVVATIAGILIPLAKVFGDYITSRPAKHAAMAARLAQKVDADRDAAGKKP